MPFRLVCLCLCLLAVASDAPLPAQTKTPPVRPADKTKPAEPIVTTSTVYYRTKGTKEWSLFGYYVSEGAARRVFEHLARTGYQTELRISNTPIPKIDSPPRTALLPVSETVSYQKTVEVFNWLVKQSDIAFRFPSDGCYARTQLMIERMERQGFKPRKLWAVANGDELYARTKNHPKGYVTWGYHVAPVLRVRNAEGGQRWYVIDPSLLQAPATVTQWMQAQMRKPDAHRPYLTITKPGEGPVWVDRKRKSGTGYWPAGDPKEGAHEHAVATMKKYKPWQGKEAPKGMVWLAPGERETTSGRDGRCPIQRGPKLLCCCCPDRPGAGPAPGVRGGQRS